MSSKIFILFMVCLLPASALAQNSDVNKLNFENLGGDGKTLYYEHRLYRNPFVGLYEASKMDSAIRYFVPLFQGMPIAKYAMNDQLTVASLTNAERKVQNKSRQLPIHLKNYKIDFWIQPYFAAIFGNFEKPIQSNTSVAIQSQLFLLPGMSFNFGILFPIVNDLDSRPDIIRPAPIFLNQFYAINHHFFSASAGFFQNDQYGANLQYRYVDLNKPWSLGMEAGLTGDYYYPRKGVYYGGLKKIIFLADVAYRINRQDLTFKLTGGQFLAGDLGGRLDVYRQFTSIEIGFYATTTSNGSTLGFNFAIPIPPGKLLQGKHARLRTTDEFRWEYSYTRGYRIGERYRTGYSLDQKLRQYHQGYLNRQYQQVK